MTRLLSSSTSPPPPSSSSSSPSHPPLTLTDNHQQPPTLPSPFTLTIRFQHTFRQLATASATRIQNKQRSPDRCAQWRWHSKAEEDKHAVVRYIIQQPAHTWKKVHGSFDNPHTYRQWSPDHSAGTASFDADTSAKSLEHPHWRQLFGVAQWRWHSEGILTYFRSGVSPLSSVHPCMPRCGTLLREASLPIHPWPPQLDS
jgi:hypothetical protein